MAKKEPIVSTAFWHEYLSMNTGKILKCLQYFCKQNQWYAQCQKHIVYWGWANMCIG